MSLIYYFFIKLAIPPLDLIEFNCFGIFFCVNVGLGLGGAVILGLVVYFAVKK